MTTTRVVPEREAWTSTVDAAADLEDRYGVPHDQLRAFAVLVSEDIVWWVNTRITEFRRFLVDQPDRPLS